MASKKKPEKPAEDPLQALLTFVANKGDQLADPGFHQAATALDEEWDRVRKAWLDAGVPGCDFGPKRPPGPSIKVRIAVGVHLEPADSRTRPDLAGKVVWDAYGSSEIEDDEAVKAGLPIWGIQDSYTVHFVEAYVPAPVASTTVEGRVDPAREAVKRLSRIKSGPNAFTCFLDHVAGLHKDRKWPECVHRECMP